MIGRRRGLGLTRRQTLRQLLLSATAALGLVAALAYAAYEAGRAQLAAEIGQLRHDHAEIAALERERAQQLIEALSRIQVLEASNAALEEELSRRIPDSRLVELVELLRARLDEGVPVERLAFVLRSVTRERHCLAEQPARLAVRVPLARDARHVASLAGGRLSVRIEGEPARDSEGRPQAWFDPLAPVRLLVVAVNGRQIEERALLPLTRSLVVDDREYRLLVQPDERRGFVRISLESCNFP